jgi:hypothetical protein
MAESPVHKSREVNRIMMTIELVHIHIMNV